MATLKETLRDIKQELLLKDDEETFAKMDNRDILLRIAITAIRRLESAITCDKEDPTLTHTHTTNHEEEAAYEEYRSIARSARKSLQRLAAHQNKKLDGRDLDSASVVNPKTKKVRKEEKEKDEKDYPPDGAGKKDEDKEKLPRIALDMGQYAATNAFEGNLAKQSKFSRLMGGAKRHPTDEATGHANPHPSPMSGVLHPTQAAGASAMNRMLNDLEAQFDVSVHHKGKRGLGA
ncbi:unnamed protein product [Phytomonas sp. Hart1]|nr:unnamed protein product [Phytomonas sp. Hart1]|eukprot:CCW69272.1 unnamed protein product [Phytomonas sp. isolate Hart1]